jgi:endonuclease/exonuclease/phosphatase family metal-dependent hydrolase
MSRQDRWRRLRIVTWNVGELYSPLGRWSRAWDRNWLDDRDLIRVAETLIELDADVVMLQELASHTQLQALLAGLDRGPVYVGAVATGCRYDRHVALLARAALEPEFLDGVLEPSGRGVVGARLRLDADRAAFVWAAHLDVSRPLRRRQQADALAAFMADHPQALVVVGGDFNLDPEWAARLSPLDLQSHRKLTAGLTDVGRSAGPTLLGLLRVDWILAGGPALVAARGIVSPRRLPLGDHSPLMATLELRPAIPLRSAPRASEDGHS